MQTETPIPASIVHIDLVTEDLEAACNFYQRTFGWELEPIDDREYVVWRASTPPGGGLSVRWEGPFVPPSTMTYVGVPDLAAARAHVTELGAKVLVEEVPVEGMGAFTVFEAPGGIVQAAWEPRGEQADGAAPEPAETPGTGAVGWVELYSADPDATQRFYEDAFGWRFEEDGASDYVFMHPPQAPVGGLMPAGDHMPPGTLTYLVVEDTDRTVKEVAANGGQVLRDPFDAGDHGRMAVFEAPGGIVQALWQSF